MKLYITQTRTLYQDNNVHIILYGRRQNGEAERVRVTGFDPYFFVPREEALKLKPRDSSDLCRVEVPDTDGLGGGYDSHPVVKDDIIAESLQGEPLARIVATHPGGVPSLREQYETTYEADVQFTDRFLIDSEIYSGVEVPSRMVTKDDVTPIDMEPVVRYHYFDIEIDDRESIPVQDGNVTHTNSEIVSISLYDSFDEEYITLVNKKHRDTEDLLPDVLHHDDKPGCVDTIALEDDEKEMLRSYFSYLQKSNPDVILAWNNLGFDAPYLIERAQAIGVEVNACGRMPNREVTSGRYEPEISGRVVYDLMKAWSRMQYSDVSASLNNAASMELGDESKVHHEESIFEMWRHDVRKLVKYNTKDVELMVKINEEAGIMRDRIELKDTVGVRFEQTYESNTFIEMLTRRMLSDWQKAGPTGTPPSGGSSDDYEGAYTFPAFSGVEKNVVQIDLASLYPFSMRMLNSSPETIVKSNADNPQEEASLSGGLTAAPNGAVYDRSEDGLFRNLVNKALELTQQAGRRRDNHEPGSEMWEYWNKSRETRKRIRNGLYGVLGWNWFFLYDEAVAESVTTISQEVIKRTSKYIEEETAGEVVYGDTDSNYISWPDEWDSEACLVATQAAVSHLNDDIYPELATEWGIPAEESEWEIEIEDFSETMVQTGAKKRYAKKLQWVEGMDFSDTLDEAQYKIAGYECKRSDTSELTNDLQKQVLRSILDEEDESDIRSLIYQHSKEITPSNPDWDYIGIPGGIKQDIDSYDSETATVRGAKVANNLLDAEISKGDKPKRVYIESTTIEYNNQTMNTDVIGFNDAWEISDIADELHVDVSRMEEVIIINPIGRICDAVGIDVTAAINGEEQGSISDWV